MITAMMAPFQIWSGIVLKYFKLNQTILFYKKSQTCTINLKLSFFTLKVEPNIIFL